MIVIHVSMSGERRTRIYTNRWFAKFANREGISNATLVAAIDQANRGLTDADLGGGLIKQRVAREGGGKSGGYRTLVFFRREQRAIFAFGFAKSDKADLSAVELRTYKQAAKIVLALTQEQIDREVHEGRMFEVNDDAQDL
ncbi:type II toxin-antitoxin system RelE/ParE family toxin [Sphingomonas sp.]|uniref:type II toxin-antitoxin system RelE/ParE family toxin n=1 Tax=Sphingomonas sp. TaxID=28214 RepID=UPI002FC70A73